MASRDDPLWTRRVGETVDGHGLMILQFPGKDMKDRTVAVATIVTTPVGWCYLTHPARGCSARRCGAALLAEPALTADESPVQVIAPPPIPGTGAPVPESTRAARSPTVVAWASRRPHRGSSSSGVLGRPFADLRLVAEQARSRGAEGDFACLTPRQPSPAKAERDHSGPPPVISSPGQDSSGHRGSSVVPRMFANWLDFPHNFHTVDPRPVVPAKLRTVTMARTSAYAAVLALTPADGEKLRRVTSGALAQLAELRTFNP